ncbi:MAG: hypothetical protein KJZ86_04170 [Caldilineaceae bacterium]|nr:hypothetical protein [Caldilineaceae bacterium]HRJ44661.1 hypothetical protein [Caldilineaceae bacterium]
MKNSMKKLTAFLFQLDAERIEYSLAHQREDAVLVAVAVPGERWEVEFFGDGSVEVERFVSSGEIYDEDILQVLFDRYTEESVLDVESFTAELVPQIG